MESIKNEDEFINSVLKSSRTALVLFYMPFIGESTYAIKTIKKYIEENGFNGKCFVLDINKFKNLADEYMIYFIPSLFIFKNGELIFRIEGLITEKILKSVLEGI